jgi:hypothetical protein
MLPDLLSFGPFFVMRIGDIGERWTSGKMGPPDPETIPSFVYHAYNFTHSFVIWGLLFVMLWSIQRYRGKTTDASVQWLIPFFAWPLHIFCDIPTHSVQFFPTPYLWPLATPFYDGSPWGNRMFMMMNYASLVGIYAVFFYRRSKIQSTQA